VPHNIEVNKQPIIKHLSIIGLVNDAYMTCMIYLQGWPNLLNIEAVCDSFQKYGICRDGVNNIGVQAHGFYAEHSLYLKHF
jgi:hypothetical protein